MLISRNKKLIVKIVTIFFIIINLFSIYSFALVNPTSDFYVNDYAGLLNDETKNYIISTNKELYRKTGAQIVVVTVKNLERNSLEDYANQLFRNFGIGDKEKNNGVLLLLALEERLFRIEVGYGLEGVLTDGKTGRIQDQYIIPYLKQNDWNAGVKNGYSEILRIVSEEYNINMEYEPAISGNTQSNAISSLKKAPILIYFSMICSLVFGFMLSYLKREKKVVKFKLWLSIILYIAIIILMSFIIFKALIIQFLFMNILGLLCGFTRIRFRRRPVEAFPVEDFQEEAFLEVAFLEEDPLVVVAVQEAFKI